MVRQRPTSRNGLHTKRKSVGATKTTAKPIKQRATSLKPPHRIFIRFPKSGHIKFIGEPIANETTAIRQARMARVSNSHLTVGVEREGVTIFQEGPPPSKKRRKK
ncbi:MAG: hypothetical protein HY093_04500 [Candidatus Liptonbacteria bacterium]|nr:hypothetical protein [Candidatus Liptonbacteria bacterium]